jgi:nitrite reductase/ring-hydroxylating ferredoxin subunit
MTRPPISVITAAQNASQRLADRDTPFVMNDWYVAAFGEEIKGQLLARTLLGRRLVFYRASDSRVVALEDRCPHRSMPLSAGTLDQDTIVCGYHGLRFNTEGDCIEVPSQAHCPQNVGIKAYRTHERGAVVWIWMGDPEQADLSKLPPQDWMADVQWERSQGYLSLQANYVRLHENLLDLTHLSFLHAKSFGTPDYAKAAFELEIGDGQFALLRNVVPTTLPPVWGVPTGLTGQGQAARIVRSEFRSLGLQSERDAAAAVSHPHRPHAHAGDGHQHALLHRARARLCPRRSRHHPLHARSAVCGFSGRRGRLGAAGTGPGQHTRQRVVRILSRCRCPGGGHAPLCVGAPAKRSQGLSRPGP